MKHQTSFVFFYLSVLLNLSNGRTLPSFIHKCKYDKTINQCIEKVFKDNRDVFMRGVPELQIPSLDPMVVDKINFNTGNGRMISLDAVFTGVTLYGCKNVVIKKIDFDFDKRTAEIVTYFPKITIEANYKMNGRFLLVQLNGAGKADGNFTEINSIDKYKGKLIQKQNKTYVDWYDKEMDLRLESASLYFHDLFKNNPALTESTNKLINENAIEIINDLKPLVQETISSVTFSIMKRVFTLYALEELFNY